MDGPTTALVLLKQVVLARCTLGWTGEKASNKDHSDVITLRVDGWHKNNARDVEASGSDGSRRMATIKQRAKLAQASKRRGWLAKRCKTSSLQRKQHQARPSVGKYTHHMFVYVLYCIIEQMNKDK